MGDADFKPSSLFNVIGMSGLVAILGIVLGTWIALRLFRWLLPLLSRYSPASIRLGLLGAEPVIRLALICLAIGLVVPIVFDVTLNNFLVIAGALGVAVGIGFKDYVSSIIAGVVAVFERPYRPGDWIRIDGDYGEVLDVGLRAIRLRTPQDDVVTVPTQSIWSKNVANSNDGTKTLMCVIDFYLQPRHEAGRVRNALHQVAITSAYLEYDKPVLVIVTELPGSTHYALKAYPFDLRDQFLFSSDLTVRGKTAIVHAGGVQTEAPLAALSLVSPTLR